MAGEILSVEVLADGWEADIKIAGRTTGGTMDFGLGANNDPATGAPKAVFTVVSLGYDDAGSPTTITRTIYGTKAVRKPYPDQATLQQTTSGSDVILRISLSDYIYQKDNVGGGNSGTAPTVTILSGLYSQGSNATTAMAVTNSSTVAYPKVIGHFATEQCRPVNETETIEIFAVHKYGTGGMPVARVTATATGATSGNVESGFATQMTLSPRGDNIPVYAIELDLSVAAGFTRGELVTVNFTAYPWVGDSAAVLDSTVDAGSQIFQLQTLKRTIMDKMISVVDPVGGNDTTGVASTIQVTADANPCLTIGGAMAKIAAANNTAHSLNRLDGGEVQCKAGSYSWKGDATGTSTNGYFTLTHHSTTNRAGVIFDNYTSSRSQKAFQRFYDVTFSRAGNIYIVFAANTNVLIMERVNFADAATSWYSGDTNSNVEFIDCTSNNGYFIKGGNDGHSRLVRSQTYVATTESATPSAGNASCVLGFRGTGGSNGFWRSLASHGTTNYILGYNIIYGLTSGLTFDNSTMNLTNVALINNLVERIGASPIPLAEMSDGNLSNLLIAHNTFAGQRFNHENDIIAPYVNKTFVDYVGKFNIFNARGDHRADIYDSDATMIGTWSVGHSVGWKSNLNEAISYAGDSDFFGLKSNFTADSTSITPTVPALFTNDKSRSGTDTGGGDYTLQVVSPAKQICPDWLLPYDLVGSPRAATGDAGAYAQTSAALRSVLRQIMSASGFRLKISNVQMGRSYNQT